LNIAEEKSEYRMSKSEALKLYSDFESRVGH
jgi:hypothetical protein